MSRTYARRRWGGWRLRGTKLRYPDFERSVCYFLCLEDLTSSAKVLDTIIRVKGKNWATDKCVSDLIHALTDLAPALPFGILGAVRRRLGE